MSSTILSAGFSEKSLRLGLVLVLCTGPGACFNGGHTSSSNTAPVSAPAPPASVTPPLPLTGPFRQLTCSPCPKIVFTSSRDGNAEIYSVLADGTELTRLTYDAAHDDDAVWSPDGNRIAFTNGLGFDSELRVMNADGSNVIHHTLPHDYVHAPSWTPDGTRITYAALSDGSSNIWMVDADGGWPVLLFSLPGWESHPSWAPDGTKLAVVSDWFAYDSVEDVLLVDPDGAGFAPLTDANIFDQLNYLWPSWSPDSARIALTLSRRIGVDNYLYHVGVINRNGTGLESLISGSNPSWSTDGSMIAFTSSSSGGRSDVSWVYADGSAWGTIIADGSNPDWRR